MDDKVKKRDPRVELLQKRINEALEELPQDRATSRFSQYLPNSGVDMASSLMQAASGGGLEGIEAVLDEYDRMAASGDRLEAQYALLLFLTHQPGIGELGLRVPSLARRSPWKLRPSRRRPDRH